MYYGSVFLSWKPIFAQFLQVLIFNGLTVFQDKRRQVFVRKKTGCRLPGVKWNIVQPGIAGVKMPDRTCEDLCVSPGFFKNSYLCTGFAGRLFSAAAGKVHEQVSNYTDGTKRSDH